MKLFSQLFERLDSTTSTNKKVDALVHYFSQCSPEDAAWAIYFMSGRRIKRLVSRTQMKRWLIEASGMETWIVDECYNNVGDLAETVSLLLSPRVLSPSVSPEHNKHEKTTVLSELSLSQWMTMHILPLQGMSEDQQSSMIKHWWCTLPSLECFLVTKFLTGSLRVGVSHLLVAKALAHIANLDRPIILHRLMGDWHPSADFYLALIHPDTVNDDISRPYPFYLASPIDKPVEDLGSIEDWSAEWKWDGIRAQVIKRQQQVFIWSRGEELVTHQFPELADAAHALPDGTVLDGEVLAWSDNGVQSFNELQKRLGRKKVSKKALNDHPVHFLAYDLLEVNNQDVRLEPLHCRRAKLTELITPLAHQYYSLSESLKAVSWAELEAMRHDSRRHRVEGIMLKKSTSTYETGRKKGAWWKWKVDPLTIDAVLIYAQAGHGRRASLFTDYTFAVWDNDQLLPVAKAYSGLTDKEINILDKWIRKNTRERFGPVRSVNTEHVFEIGFEAINPSTRHKSGVALRFPRILRWRHDMKAKDANTLTMVKDMMSIYHRDS